MKRTWVRIGSLACGLGLSLGATVVGATPASAASSCLPPSGKLSRTYYGSGVFTEAMTLSVTEICIRDGAGRTNATVHYKGALGAHDVTVKIRYVNETTAHVSAVYACDFGGVGSTITTRERDFTCSFPQDFNPGFRFTVYARWSVDAMNDGKGTLTPDNEAYRTDSP